MFLAYKEGMPAVVLTASVFSLVTIAMVVGQSCLTYAGVRLVKAPWLERYAHTMAGITIVATAAFVMIAGI
jgi:hypothetical protein